MNVPLNVSKTALILYKKETREGTRTDPLALRPPVFGRSLPGSQRSKKALRATVLPLSVHNIRFYMNKQVRDERSVEVSGGTSTMEGPLEDKSLLLGEEGSASETPDPDIDALRTLIGDVDRQGATYQSVAVAAVQILERALRYEREAAEAALSLGQQEKLESMVKTATRTVAVLRDTLNAQGHKVMHLCSEQSAPEPEVEEQSSGQSWEPVLANALGVLEEGTEQMSSLTTGQPSGSPARRLSERIAQLLRSHHDALLLEAEDWGA